MKLTKLVRDLVVGDVVYFGSDDTKFSILEIGELENRPVWNPKKFIMESEEQIDLLLLSDLSEGWDRFGANDELCVVSKE